MKKTTMYEIIGQGRVIFDEIQENIGELTAEIQEALTITEELLQPKSIAYLEVRGQKKAIIERVDAEIKRLQAIIKIEQNIVDVIEETMIEAVKTFGDITVGFTTITTRKSESIEVLDVNALPSEYKTVKVVETADKLALKKAIKEGIAIDGVKLVENLNLRIK